MVNVGRLSTCVKLSWRMSGGVTTEEVNIIGDVILDKNTQVITFRVRTDDEPSNVQVTRHIPLRSLWEWQVTTR